MKRIFGYLLFTLAVVSCGTDEGRFRLEGTFKGFNQGELYIYGLNGTHGLDTIHVNKGEFRYEIPLEAPATFMLVFPNFSELPVFGGSGAEVRIKADATHLKETEIKGTDENERMTAFRLKASRLMPPEVSLAAAQFIRENPASPIAFYLLSKYFIQTPSPDYQEAAALAETVRRAQPGHAELGRIVTQLKALKGLKTGAVLPAFTALDTNGKRVSSTDLNAPANVVSVWATWNYESQALQRQLLSLQKRFGSNKLKILSICLDADPKKCRQWAERDSIKWSNVCDGRMWETPVLQKTGLSTVPDLLVIDSQGRIVAHVRDAKELVAKIEDMLI